ncbi:MAG: GFA family protein [Betaproteobacteria bacterium]
MGNNSVGRHGLHRRASVKASDFHWTQGDQLVTYYGSSLGTHRGYCRLCGSPLLGRFDFEPTFYGLPPGTLGDYPVLKPKRHVFVAHMAP